ncbi:MAG: biotin synthase BioB [Syntrophales bacterium]|nr:biotin synthase BioB [Syntrophales bacterium]
MFNKKIITITEKIMEDAGNSISYEEACELSVLPVDDTIDLIMCANKIRNKYKKNSVFTCSIINAKSGFCPENCAFCAQSAHHKTEIETYPLLSEEELVDNALRMYEAGATKYSMVTSGTMLTDEEIKTISRAASNIKEKTDLMICASLGMLTEPMARRLKEGGITTYHHNLETARSYFDQICTTHDYDEDIQTVKFAQSTGLKACSGGILGLGETWEQRIELAFTLKELDVDIVPINFLNPVAGTRMESMPLLSPMEALKCIALFRFINPGKDITICGGREVTLQDYQSWTFMAGANGLMIGNYLTTQGRNAEMDTNMIQEMGLI